MPVVPRRALWTEPVTGTLALFCALCGDEGPLGEASEPTQWQGSGRGQTATVPGFRAGTSGREREGPSDRKSVV